MIHCTYGGVLGTVHILCHPFDRRVWVDTWLNTKPEFNIVTWANACTSTYLFIIIF